MNAFEINGTYYLRHFFEPDGLFDELRYYYNNQQHRFEVPSSAFPALRTLLRGHNYTVVVVRDIEPYVIAVRKYTPHPGNVFTTSVYQWSVREHNCFLLRDETAIEAAVSQGAVSLQKATGVSVEDLGAHQSLRAAPA